MTTVVRLDRERILRTLTFWLRPAFVLRTLTRFQRVAGFDRAIALASSAFTTLVPLGIVVSAIVPRLDATQAAQTIINRYGLTGGGAQAVKDLLSPGAGTNTDVSVLGALLLVIAVLSFSRSLQRLFEQTWELKPLSVRNTLNNVLWISVLVGYIAASWWIHHLLDRGRVQIASNLLLLPASAIFLALSGWLLSAKRIGRARLAPFAILGALLLGVYLTGAGFYLPHLFSSYASRYGVIGAVLAMISALFAFMVVLVASAAVAREVFEELDRVRRGERPPDDEIKREWHILLDELRSRRQTLREHIERRRRQGSRDDH
jgi:membrane protein